MLDPKYYRCLHQHCDLVSLSVVCVLPNHGECPYSLRTKKDLCSDFKHEVVPNVI